MTSFTFSLEQLKAAPPEVRRWVEHEIGVALGALGRLDHDTSQVHSSALAPCAPEEALQMFEWIKDNFVLSPVFFRVGTLGMTLPHVGPSEDIAGHAPAFPRPGNPSL